MLRLLAIVALAACVLGSPVKMHLTESKTLAMASSLGWQLNGAANSDDTVSITFGLNHPEGAIERLNEIFVGVSTPGSATYGQYLTDAELHTLVAPLAGAEAAVRDFLRQHQADGHVEVIGTGDLIRAKVSVAQAKAMLQAPIYSFTHSNNKHTILRSDIAVPVPAALKTHVQVVMGLSSFPNLMTPKKSSPVDAQVAVTPAVLKKLYQIGNTTYGGSSKSAQALAEFQGQAFLPSDLESFESHFNLPNQPARNITPGGTASAGVEAELDIQYIIATGTGIPTDFYLHPGNEFDLIGWAGAVLTYPAETRPLVWSVSYGEGVNGGIGGKIAVDYVDRFNTEIVKSATLGISVLIASGDSGVYDRQEPFGGLFHPSFPCCVPSVTCVGATQLEGDGSETTGVSFSGGGFTPAQYFVRSNASTWQEQAVEAYLSSGVALPPAHLWDKTGRGVPDVSAVGVDFDVYVQGHLEGVSGTSASTPAFAGVISLINDARLAAGKPSMGFLNPWIYSNQTMFHDITKGKNNGGGVKPGFVATTGWDPVTGMGTPNFAAMVESALSQ